MNIVDQPTMHLSENEFRPHHNRCPGCNESCDRIILKTIQRNPHVELVRCPVCGICYADRFPTDELLGRYYARYYAGRPERTTIDDPDRLAKHIVAMRPGNNRVRRGTVIDFGGGDGAVGVAAAMLFADECRVIIVDQAAYPLVEQPGRVHIEHATSIDEVDDLADVVIASASLEHVPAEMFILLSKLFSRLIPGGIFYARTPYIEPVLRIAPWLSFSFPGHLYDIGPEYWKEIARRYPDLYLLASQPSLIETTFGRHPLRTAAAWAMKAPARLGFPWPFYFGHEVCFYRP